jgi:hypothetical protein
LLGLKDQVKSLTENKFLDKGSFEEIEEINKENLRLKNKV